MDHLLQHLKSSVARLVLSMVHIRNCDLSCQAFNMTGIRKIKEANLKTQDL